MAGLLVRKWFEILLIVVINCKVAIIKKAQPSHFYERLSLKNYANGESGIRTLGTLSGTRHFECRTFNRSDNSPKLSALCCKKATG